MPKIKSNRGAAKRFKVTGSGKLVRARAYKSHILTKKTSKRKRRLRQGTDVDAANVGMLRRMLPYLWCVACWIELKAGVVIYAKG
jgi:large subunit ribosomal protein L35